MQGARTADRANKPVNADLIIETPKLRIGEGVLSIPVSVSWHRRNGSDPRIKWIRQLVAAI